MHYSRPRYTGDLDVWVDPSQENADRVVKVLHDFGFRGDDVTPEMITSQREIVRMGFEPMRLEIFSRLPGVEFADCYDKRVTVAVDQLQVPFMGLEDLKENKRATGRPKDLQDLEELP